MSATPPHWAEALLTLVLKRDDVDSVSGDLLEEYRDSVLPIRGRRSADWWYVKEVFGFVWRSGYVSALLFAAAFLLRTALDWWLPPITFHTRALVSTTVATVILLSAGCWAAWRSGSFLAGTAAGLATAGAGAFVSVAGAAALLAFRHDPATMMAIQASGGLYEVFLLPFAIVVPAMCIGTLGGVVGAALRRRFAVST